MKKTYFHESDGHTYYFKNQELYACPTNRDGSFDKESEMAVKEFTIPLDQEEITNIKGHLKS